MSTLFAWAALCVTSSAQTPQNPAAPPTLQREIPTATPSDGAHISGFFKSVSEELIAVKPEDLSKTQRDRLVQIDLDAFSGLNTNTLRTIALPLFDDVSLTANVTTVMRSYSGDLTFWGHLAKPHIGSFRGVLTRSAVAISIDTLHAGSFLVYPLVNGQHVVRALPPSAPFQCGTAMPPPVPGPGDRRQAPVDPTPGSESLSGVHQVDGIIVYTPSGLRILEAWASPVDLQTRGCLGTMATLVQLLEARMNQSLADSLITDVQYTLLGQALVDITDGAYGNLEDFLDDIEANDTNTDSHFFILDELRSVAGADQVTVLCGINDPGDLGIAWVIQNPWAFGADQLCFAVCQTETALTDITWVHEMGHNLGCAHERSSGDDAGAEDYSFAHEWTDGPLDMATVMHSSMAVPLNTFSTPLVSWTNPATGNTFPTGIASGPNSANNALTIQETAPWVSGFRSRNSLEDLVWVEPSTDDPFFEETGGEWFPYNTVVEAVMRVNVGGVVQFKDGTYPERLGVAKRCIFQMGHEDWDATLGE